MLQEAGQRVKRGIGGAEAVQQLPEGGGTDIVGAQQAQPIETLRIGEGGGRARRQA